MMAAAVWKIKNCNIFAMDGLVSRKFGMVMCLDPPDLLSIQNFMLLKIQQGGQLPLENIKKHDISKIICTYFSRILVC